MKKIFLLAAAALALAACDKNDDTPVASPVAARVSATIGETAVTRASDNKWTQGDSIGITATVGGVAKHINMKYITDGSEKFTGNPIYFYKPMALTAYYPFAGAEGTAAGLIAAKTDAGKQTAGEQPKIDFLWGSNTEISIVDNNPEIHFGFTHKMSKLTLIFKSGTGMDVSSITRYEIEGLVLEGTFDTATGMCAAKPTTDSETLVMPVEGVESDKPVASLILFPQSRGKDNVTLHIYTNEVGNAELLQHYTCTLGFEEGDIKPGYNYQYTITVNKVGVTVGSPSITDWTTKQSAIGASSAR